MTTVSSNLELPMKLIFPKKYSMFVKEYTILGLGDLVIPGIFVAFGLRFDFISSLCKHKLKTLIESDQSNGTNGQHLLTYLHAKAKSCDK